MGKRRDERQDRKDARRQQKYDYKLAKQQQKYDKQIQKASDRQDSRDYARELGYDPNAVISDVVGAVGRTASTIVGVGVAGKVGSEFIKSRTDQKEIEMDALTRQKEIENESPQNETFWGWLKSHFGM